MKSNQQQKARRNQIMIRPDLLRQTFTFTIGGSDGPTSVFIAGKIGGLEIFLGICVIAVTFLALAALFIKKHH